MIVRRLAGRWVRLAAIVALVTSADSRLPTTNFGSDVEDVLMVGCREVTSNQTCVIDDTSPKPLTVWVSTVGTTTTTVRVDGLRVHRPLEAVGGGLRFTLEPGPDWRFVELHQTDVDGRPLEPWRRRVEARALLPALAEAAARIRNGRFDTDQLQALRAHRRADVRGAAFALLARIAVARGAYDDAIELLEQSIELHRASGNVTSEIRDRSVLAYVSTNIGDYGQTERALAPIATLASADRTSAIFAKYYEGSLATQISDYRRALRLFRQVLKTSERVGEQRRWSATAEEQVHLLVGLGRLAEAQALLEAILERIPTSPHCVRADALIAAGDLTAIVQGARSAAPKLLSEAIDILANDCSKPRLLAYTRARLGLIFAASESYAEAQERLTKSRAAHDRPGVPLRLAQLELEARVHMGAQRHEEAEVSFARLVAVADLHDKPEIKWRALVGHGRANEALGRLDRAETIYRRAEHDLDHLAQLAPLGGGRGTFLQGHVQSASRLVDLLVRRGRHADAAKIAHRSRSRLLASLAWPARLDAASPKVRSRWFEALATYARHRAENEIDDDVWGVAIDRLEQRVAQHRKADEAARALLDQAFFSLGASIAEGDLSWKGDPNALLLSYHPVNDGWVVFVSVDDQVRSHRIPDIDPTAFKETLSRQLLSHVGPDIARADRLQLALFGSLETIDVHALPYDGRPLVASIAVEYRVGVRPTTATDAGTSRALIVSPSSKLRNAKQERTFVTKKLRARGYIVERIDDRLEAPATFAGILRSNPPEHLHYTGHAKFDGIDGWESHLGPTGALRLTVADIVVLPRAPTQVFLAACETAVTPSRTSGLGLAQAFVLGGSRSVVATSRPVRDEHALAIVHAFYDSASDDAASALRAAQMAFIDADSDVDWPSFRVLVP